MEAESSTDQTVVAPPVIAAVAVEARAGTGGGARLAKRAAGDAGRACSAGHPCQDHVNKGPQDQAHRHGHTESYDQRDWEERNINHVSYIL